MYDILDILSSQLDVIIYSDTNQVILGTSIFHIALLIFFFPNRMIFNVILIPA